MKPTDQEISSLRSRYHYFIQITDQQPVTRHLEARGERGAMTLRSQTGYLFGKAEYPRAFEVSLEKEQAPYAPGFYQFSAESFVIDEFQRLSLSKYRRELVQLDTPKRAAA